MVWCPKCKSSEGDLKTEEIFIDIYWEEDPDDIGFEHQVFKCKKCGYKAPVSELIIWLPPKIIKNNLEVE